MKQLSDRWREELYKKAKEEKGRRGIGAHLWSLINTERKRAPWRFIGLGLAATAVGLWTIFTYVKPPKSPEKESAKAATITNTGGVAIGGNVYHSCVGDCSAHLDQSYSDNIPILVENISVIGRSDWGVIHFLMKNVNKIIYTNTYIDAFLEFPENMFSINDGCLRSSDKAFNRIENGVVSRIKIPLPEDNGNGYACSTALVI